MLTYGERRYGFTLVEVIIAMAILVILSAILVPGLTRQLSTSQGSNLVQDIRAINSGIQEFRENVGRYPTSVSQLTTFASGSVQSDACGMTIPANNVNQWRGPYIGLTPLATGIPSGDASILLPLTRTPATTSSSTSMDGVLSFDIISVDSVSAAEVENALDGVSGDNTIYSTGTVLWSPTGGIAGTLGYIGTITVKLPVRGC